MSTVLMRSKKYVITDIFLLGLVLLASSGVVRGSAAQDTQAAERKQVEPVAKTLIDAFRAQDVSSLKTVFADKVRFVGDLAFLGEPKGTPKGQREITRDELAKAYTSFFTAIGKEKWDGLLKQTTTSLVRAAQKGGHPDDSRGELPKDFVLVGDYVFQITFPGSGLDDIILFVLRPTAGKWQIVAHWADY